jgi:hypothetical protein
MQAIAAEDSAVQGLDQIGPSRQGQFLHDLPHVLRVFTANDQQRVLSIDNYQVLYTNQRHEFLWAEDVVI